MSEEDIDRIAKRVLELQREQRTNQTHSWRSFKTVQHKYHDELYKKYGTTGRIEDAIRTVATYSQGKRAVSKLNEKEFDKAIQVADKLYKLVLGIEVEEEI